MDVSDWQIGRLSFFVTFSNTTISRSVVSLAQAELAERGTIARFKDGKR